MGNCLKSVKIKSGHPAHERFKRFEKCTVPDYPWFLFFGTFRLPGQPLHSAPFCTEQFAPALYASPCGQSLCSVRQSLDNGRMGEPCVGPSASCSCCAIST